MSFTIRHQQKCCFKRSFSESHGDNMMVYLCRIIRWQGYSSLSLWVSLQIRSSVSPMSGFKLDTSLAAIRDSGTSLSLTVIGKCFNSLVTMISCRAVVSVLMFKVTVRPLTEGTLWLKYDPYWRDNFQAIWTRRTDGQTNQYTTYTEQGPSKVQKINMAYPRAFKAYTPPSTMLQRHNSVSPYLSIAVEAAERQHYKNLMPFIGDNLHI